MKFMIIRKADEATEAGVMPTAELMKSMMDYNRELADAGVLRAGAGLHPSTKGARVTFPAGNPTVLDGPFSETKELIAGYTIIETDSLEDAIGWVKRWPTMDTEAGAVIEIRQFLELEDFGDDVVTPEIREAIGEMPLGSGEDL